MHTKQLMFQSTLCVVCLHSRTLGLHSSGHLSLQQVILSWVHRFASKPRLKRMSSILLRLISPTRTLYFSFLCHSRDVFDQALPPSLSGGLKVIRRIIAWKEGESGG